MVTSCTKHWTLYIYKGSKFFLFEFKSRGIPRGSLLGLHLFSFHMAPSTTNIVYALCLEHTTDSFPISDPGCFFLLVTSGQHHIMNWKLITHGIIPAGLSFCVLLEMHSYSFILLPWFCLDSKFILYRGEQLQCHLYRVPIQCQEA